MKNRRKYLVLISSAILLLAIGCTQVPKGVNTITGFEVERYLGTWHEIARLDHSFERDLEQVTASYSLNPDGTIKVINRGFNTEKGIWKDAEGRAKFVGPANEGRLKVSFFGPFYGGYNIMALDKENYSWVLVCGPNRKYLWILAREKSLDPEILDKLKKHAREAGFAVDELIMVQQ